MNYTTASATWNLMENGEFNKWLAYLMTTKKDFELITVIATVYTVNQLQVGRELVMTGANVIFKHL